jgi:hypothetical protein
MRGGIVECTSVSDRSIARQYRTRAAIKGGARQHRIVYVEEEEAAAHHIGLQ